MDYAAEMYQHYALSAPRGPRIPTPTHEEVADEGMRKIRSQVPYVNHPLPGTRVPGMKPPSIPKPPTIPTAYGEGIAASEPSYAQQMHESYLKSRATG